MVAEGSSAVETNPRFALVQQLGRELSGGQLEVPGFPDIAVRVRKALQDTNCTADSVSKIVSAEPMIAARLLRMANSAALKPGKVEIKDLKTAVNRIGFALVRSAAISFAVEQMKLAHNLDAVKKELEDVWHDSAAVAANAYVLARRCRGINPDEALLAGLMHSVGKLYVLSRAEQHPTLFDDPDELAAVMAEWYVPIGEAILQNWEFSTDMVGAVSAQLERDKAVGEAPDLGDFLIVAVLLREIQGKDTDDMIAALNAAKTRPRLGLSAEEVLSLVEESEQQINELKRSLGD